MSTSKTLVGDWYLSGDLAVWHPDGYIEIKDRSKDIIISGGENISTLEVEEVLSQHPAVLFAAVVAQPDPTWGETPCAFLELKLEAEVSETEIIQFCRQSLARFKVPKAGGLRRTAEDFHRQDPEIYAARAGSRRELIECSVLLNAKRRVIMAVKIERFQPEGMNIRMSEGQPSYSHVVTVSGTGKIVYIAGQLARDIDGNCVGKGDMRAQMEQTFQNLDRCLKAAGATWADVVKTNTFVTDFDEFQKCGDVRMRYFGVATPTSTTVGVTRLAGPDFMIEIEAVAVVDA